MARALARSAAWFGSSPVTVTRSTWVSSGAVVESRSSRSSASAGSASSTGTSCSRAAARRVMRCEAIVAISVCISTSSKPESPVSGFTALGVTVIEAVAW